MNHLIWDHVLDERLCSLIAVENVENEFQLRYGFPRVEGWPPNALMRMNPEYKTSLRLSDSLHNDSGLLVASQPLKEFCERAQIPQVEYLPVTIYNHKGRVASDAYFIVHQVGTQDCIDVGQSRVTWNLIKKDQISSVSKLVLDESKIAPDATLFRAEHLPWNILIRRDLAERIQAAGYTGIRFLELEGFRVV